MAVYPFRSPGRDASGIPLADPVSSSARPDAVLPDGQPGGAADAGSGAAPGDAALETHAAKGAPGASGSSEPGAEFAPGIAPGLTHGVTSPAQAARADGKPALPALTDALAAVLILAALALIAMATLLLDPGPGGLVATAIGVTLMLLAAGMRIRMAHGRRSGAAQARLLARLHRDDPQPVIVTDRQGMPVAANPAAGAQTPVCLIARHCAEPERLVDDLRQEALCRGHAERVLNRNGKSLRLSALRVAAQGGPAALLLVWQRADLPAQASRPVTALGLPVLTLGPGNAPLAANPALRRLCTGQEDDATAVSHATVADLPGMAALLPQLTPLRDADPAMMPTPARPVTLLGRPMLARAAMAQDGQIDIVLTPSTHEDAAPRFPLSPPSSATPSFPPDLGNDQPATTPLTAEKADQAAPHATPPLAAFADFENLPVALMLIETDGAVRRSNRLARDLLGLTPGPAPYLSELVEALGRPVADWLADAQAGRALNRPEVMRATRPSQETFVQIILRRAPAAGRLLFAVISDATEMKTLEARFVQSQKMQAIGQLAGGVAHDFNNLLTAISGHCDLLLLNRDYYDPEYDDLMQIHQNANRAAALVRQLLAFSRRQTMKPEKLPLENLLEDLAQLLTRLVGERIALKLSHDRRLGPIWADRRQLEQVIMNLVVNARDAMPMGGEIRIRTSALHLEQDRERGRARIPAGDYALIEVEDEGIGIPDDNLDKIFEPFFTTKKPGEGTGLGLSTAYGIVKQLGGYIFADSTEGTGTVFSLYFATYGSASFPGIGHDDGPAAPAVTWQAEGAHQPAPSISGAARAGETPARPGTEDVADATGPSLRPAGAAIAPPMAEAPPAAAPFLPDPCCQPAAANPSGDLRNLVARPVLPGAVSPGAVSPATPAPATAGTDTTVLLVEDEAPVRAFAARALRLQGYRVIEAENGEQALHFLQEPTLAVDIFVSDVVMPGLDGPGWVAQALEQRPDTPVVFTSGYAEDSLSAALSRIRGAVFLDKPFSLTALSRLIEEQMSWARNKGAGRR